LLDSIHAPAEFAARVRGDDAAALVGVKEAAVGRAGAFVLDGTTTGRELSAFSRPSP
jgi:hypothetical protein